MKTSTPSSSSRSLYYQLTVFGQEVTKHSMDLRAGMVVAVCERFNLELHGRIAAAYIQSSKDCFARNEDSLSGLSQKQVEVAGELPSNIHVATNEYLKFAGATKECPY